MPSEILGQQFVATMSAWHNLGIVDRAIKSAVEAVKRGKMNWNIHKIPASYTMPDGTTVADTSAFTLWREPIADDPTWTRLSANLVGPDYDFWQNQDVADRVDMLSESTGWAFSTAGVLAKGKTFFVCLDMGETTIAGETYNQFFTYIEERDGRTKSWGIVSKIRVVCRNTSNLALRNATGKIGIRHGADYKSVADWSMDIIAEANKRGEDVNAALNLLAQVKMDDERMNAVLNAVAPMPDMPTLLTMPNLTGRMKEKQDAAATVYERAVIGTNRVRDRIILNYNSLNDTMPSDLRGTGMAAFQSVTEYTTHQHGTLGVRGRKMDAASRASADLFDIGQQMRDRAYTSIVGDF